MFDVILISTPNGLDLSRWQLVRTRHPNLRPIEPFSRRNPISRETTTVPTPNSADVVVRGDSIGQFFWDDARLLCPLEFPEHQEALRHIATELAADLAATVVLVDEGDLDVQPRV